MCLLSEAAPSPYLSSLSTPGTGFLCPNTSSKAPKHPQRKENILAHLKIPICTRQFKGGHRLRNTCMCTPLYFAMLGKELGPTDVLHKCSTLSYSSKRNHLISHKIQIKITHQSSSQYHINSVVYQLFLISDRIVKITMPVSLKLGSGQEFTIRLSVERGPPKGHLLENLT